MTAMQHIPGLRGPDTPQADLVRVLSGPMMSEEELTVRMTALNGEGVTADTVTPARVLRSIGGAAALPMLVEILLHEPEPEEEAGLPILVLRPNVIRTIAQIKGADAVAALMHSYDTHLALELGLVRALEDTGVDVPYRYERLLDHAQPADLTAVSARLPSVSSALHGFWAHMADTYLRDNPWAVGLLAVTAWQVRLDIVESLEGHAESSVDRFLHDVLLGERCNYVLWAAAISLGARGDGHALKLLSDHVRTSPTDYCTDPLSALRSPPQFRRDPQLRRMLYVLADHLDDDSRDTLGDVHDRLADDKDQRHIREFLAKRLVVQKKRRFFSRS